MILLCIATLRRQRRVVSSWDANTWLLDAAGDHALSCSASQYITSGVCGPLGTREPALPSRSLAGGEG